MAPFSRLVRFKNPAGSVFYGEVPESGNNLATQETLLGSRVPVYKGAAPFDDDFTLTNQKEEIAEVCYQWWAVFCLAGGAAILTSAFEGKQTRGRSQIDY